MQSSVKLSRKIGMTTVVLLWMTVAVAGAQRPHSVVPKHGYVPDQETAIRIADAVLSKIYGAEKIAHEKPLVADLKDGVWFVSGSLPRATAGQMVLGGVATIEISKAAGKILRVSHGK